MDSLYPLRFEEILKEKIWGGRNLAHLFDKRLPADALVGESWEVSDRDDDQSLVLEGALKGATLGDLVARYGEQLVGKHPLAKGKFPLLFKIIDAQQQLSVQVHPTDELALTYAESDPGKTEMWYVLAAREGAELMVGLQSGVTKEDFWEAVQTGRFEECLNYFKVKGGDAFFLPAGSVHALGAGIMVAEIQENSDATYRVYDWGRIGSDGKPREIHLEKALSAINFERPSTNPVSGITVCEGENRRTVLAACRYFATELLEIHRSYRDERVRTSFSILFFVEGNPLVVWDADQLQIRRGQTLLMPAEINEWTVEGSCKVLKFYVPDIATDIIEPMVKRGVTDEEINLIGGDAAMTFARWKTESRV